MEADTSVEQFFPLEDISGVVQLFKFQMEDREPDLALLSIIVGSIENMLTCNRTNTVPDENENENDNDNDSDSSGNTKLPVLDYKIMNALYTKFHTMVKGFVDMSVFGDIKYATRELVKKVSDVIWNSLTRSYYKDRAHLQSLYSYLTGNKLDCFGVAFAVVAGCQVLGFKDVHLALSEDHAWVVFGENSSETAEVTWHGKGNEDKRGQPVDNGIASRCWLYLNGYAVVCNRQMEVAALVSSMNSSLNVNNDAMEVSSLQQELLWLLYDKGCLSHYPMAIGNLGDLEEINPTAGRPPCSSLFQEGVLSARMYYNNMHVYPYAYQGGFFYRHKMYKEAFESWANSGDVLKQYNYTRDDEEIYKEVMEIANDLIPHIMKVVSSGHSAHSILKDPECFAHLLRFYDGICQWEEGSQTPVLHIGWAKPLVNTISKFDAEVRGKVVILEQDVIENGDENCNMKVTNKEKQAKSKGNKNRKSSAEHVKTGKGCVVKKEVKNKLIFGQNLAIENTPLEELHPDIKALTAACGERILNRDFLIQGGGEPFVGSNAGISSEMIEYSVNDLLQTTTAKPKIILCSEKMRGLKNLLLGEKLNTHAISLQLTAQSQVQVGGKKSAPKETEPGVGVCVRSKRSRRE